MKFKTIYEKRTTLFDIWVGLDTRNQEYVTNAFKKVKGGVKHLVWRYKQFDLNQIKKDLAARDWFSARPYKPGQVCDGSIDQPVAALYYAFCKAKELDPKAIYQEAYGECDIDYELVKDIAEWQGVAYPEEWGEREFDLLLESLHAVNNHSLAAALTEKVEALQPAV